MNLPIPGTKVGFGTTPLISKSVESVSTPTVGNQLSIIRESQADQLLGLSGQLLSPALLATKTKIEGASTTSLIVSALLLLREDESQRGSAIPDADWNVYFNLSFDLDGGTSSDENSIPSFYKLTVYFVYNQSW